MNDILLGIQILDNTIAFDQRHADYDRVTSLAKEYFDIFTGSGIEEYLKKYRKNQDDESFKQMLEIYETSIPSTVHNLDVIFEKPLRSNRIFNTIDHDSATARDEILSRIKSFWQGETESGLDAYLKERWKHLAIYDPNAFIVIEFAAFNPVKEKAEPFAIEYSSDEAINYQYLHGTLDWLICKKTISYQTKAADNVTADGEPTEWKEGAKYFLYLENEAVSYTEVDPVYRLTDIPNPVFVEIRKDPKSEKPDHVFVREDFETKSEGVPAFRAGYLQDPESVSLPRTTLSTIHYSLAFLKKELKSGAELDLTIRAHVFPQKYMYGPKCDGDKEGPNPVPCLSGRTPNGGTCDVCHGTGVAMPVHTTATDLIVVPFPKKDTEPVIDLTKAVAYFSPPLELVKFMEEYTDRLTQKAKGAVFPSQAISQSKNTFSSDSSTGPTTATEQDYSWDSVYDAYRPFTSKYSYAWLFITNKIAVYTDNAEGFSNYHSFPSDYKLKPIDTLTLEAKNAKDAGLPQHVLEAMHDDIAQVVYADDPDTLTKIEIKNKFHPFSGKSESEMQSLLSSGDLLPYYQTLYTYFDIIFSEIDEEIGDKFYLLTYDKQKAEVERRVNVLLNQVNQQKQQALKDAQQRMKATGFGTKDNTVQPAA